MTTLATGAQAPSFNLIGLDGQPYRLDKARAPVLAVFFKVSCETCRLTLPYLERLYRTYPRQGWHLWAISQDSAEDSRAFAGAYDLTFPILLDDGWAVSRAYDPEGVPTLFLIASDGQIARVVVAFQKAALNELAAAIADHVGQEAVVIAPQDDPAPAFRPG